MTMPVNGEQSLPVVRVGEIKSEQNLWLVEELWGASSVGVIGGTSAPRRGWGWTTPPSPWPPARRAQSKYAVRSGPVLVYLAEDIRRSCGCH